ncbi:peptide ABC transporter substrate-binding protein [Brevibacillus daliensis]|uniref:peptide ABC transporter substrate-binding protein n=1 Tax=Brevibacillus daliensis TaxID=2892995 RepID=UPI001E567F1A|nr:peptide ABC transporter substrate-binding protein [Brevibacillus daliensis]
MKKVISSLASLCLLSISISACSTPASPQVEGKKEETAPAETAKGGEKVLRYTINAEPPTADPGIATDSNSFDIIYAMFEGLTNYDTKGNLINTAAENYKISEDGKTYTFTLRQGMKWNNGDPVTAHDFEYAIKRNLDPKTASGYAYQLYYIKGGEEFNTGKGSVDQVGVKAIDEHTLEFQLKAPTPFFLELVFFPTLFPLHKASVEGNPNWANEPKTIVSNGPFNMETWEHKSKITFVKNETYWDKANVPLDRIEMTIIEDSNTALSMFEQGETDWAGYPAFTLPGDAIPQYKKDNKLEVAFNPGSMAVTFNTSKAPFNNAKIRKAFGYAIERQSLIDNVVQVDVPPAYGWVPTSMGVNPDGYFKEDAAKAKQLLEEGMKEAGLSTFPEVTYYFDNDAINLKIAQALQDQWKKTLGVDVKLKYNEYKVFYADRKNGNYDFAYYRWGADFNDPINFLEIFKDKEGGNNIAKWENKEFASLLDKSYNETDNEKRKQLFLQAETILMEEMPIAPIHFRGNPFVKTDKVKGFVIYPLGGSYFKFTDIVK